MNLTKKPLKDYNKIVRDVFEKISYSKTHLKEKLIGSHTLETVDYPSDYDMFEIVIEDTNEARFKKRIVSRLKKIMRGLKKTKTIYFMELMAGDKKWKLDEILSDDFNTSIFDDKSVFKLEVIKWDNKNSLLIPISIVYEFYIYNKNGQNIGLNQEKPTVDTIKSLNQDIKKFKKEKNRMKVLKRKFTKSMVEKDKTMNENLLLIFNSEYGKLYKLIGDLKTAISLLEMYNAPRDRNRVKLFLKTLEETFNTFKMLTFTQRQHNLLKSAIRKRTDKEEKIKQLKGSLLRTLNLKLKDVKV
jgi:hypothetical protein